VASRSYWRLFSARRRQPKRSLAADKPSDVANDAGNGSFTVGYITPPDVIFQRVAVKGSLLGGGPDHFRCVGEL
jgi:hypothetical protein